MAEEEQHDVSQRDMEAEPHQNKKKKKMTEKLFWETRVGKLTPSLGPSEIPDTDSADEEKNQRLWKRRNALKMQSLNSLPQSMSEAMSQALNTKSMRRVLHRVRRHS